jgi:dTMP kinase
VIAVSDGSSAAPRPVRGLFLVLEGGEGAGKSTHIHWVAEYLRSRGIDCRVVREPGGTPAGERARDIVLDASLRMCAETELLLLLAARAEFVRSVLRPALEAGEVVLADRYELSTYAYQGMARGLGLDEVRRLNEFATGGLKPDAVFVLRVDPDAGLRRKRQRADRLESAGREFHRRVAAAYDELAAQEPNVVSIDSSGPKAEVRERLLSELKARFPETFDLEAGLRS